jgi:hypothetical protein
VISNRDREIIRDTLNTAATFFGLVGHSHSFRADFDNRTMTEAGGVSSLARGGAL